MPWPLHSVHLHVSAPDQLGREDVALPACPLHVLCHAAVAAFQVGLVGVEYDGCLPVVLEAQHMCGVVNRLQQGGV